MKLFLLPGLDGTGELFEPFLNAMPSDFTIVVISYPKHPQTFEEHVRFVASKLPVDEPFSLLAESFSGPVAIEILKSEKFEIEKAIFVATFSQSPRPALLALASCLPLSLGLKLPIPTFAIRLFCFGDHGTPEQITSFKRVLKTVPPSVSAKRLRILARSDASDGLGQISVPVLYLRATKDRMVPSSCVRLFERKVKHLEVEEIDGPHFILQAAPVRCAERINAFLEPKPIAR